MYTSSDRSDRGRERKRKREKKRRKKETEKESIFNKALEGNWSLFLEHDLHTECINLKMTEKGVRLNETFQVKDFI